MIVRDDFQKRSTLLAKSASEDEVELSDFNLETCLGIGAFSKVYRAIHRKQIIKYAIKVIRNRDLVSHTLVEGLLKK